MAGHKLFFKQFVQFLNTTDENLAQQLINPQAIFYVSHQVETFEGPKGYLTIIEKIKNHFSELHWRIEDINSEKDKYYIRFSISNLKKGDETVPVSSVNIYRLANNQIIEGYENSLNNILQQTVSHQFTK